MPATGLEEAFCMWSGHFWVKEWSNSVRKHAKTKGVWRHAPPENFCNLQPLRRLLVASETSLTVNILILK